VLNIFGLIPSPPPPKKKTCFVKPISFYSRFTWSGLGFGKPASDARATVTTQLITSRGSATSEMFFRSSVSRLRFRNLECWSVSEMKQKLALLIETLQLSEFFWCANCLHTNRPLKSYTSCQVCNQLYCKYVLHVSTCSVCT
jgi:hypothetical protein